MAPPFSRSNSWAPSSPASGRSRTAGGSIEPPGATEPLWLRVFAKKVNHVNPFQPPLELLDQIPMRAQLSALNHSTHPPGNRAGDRVSVSEGRKDAAAWTLPHRGSIMRSRQAFLFFVCSLKITSLSKESSRAKSSCCKKIPRIVEGELRLSEKRGACLFKLHMGPKLKVYIRIGTCHPNPESC